MSTQPPDFRRLPAETPREETLALQIEQDRVNGPGGGGSPVSAIDGDGD
jgi:hypothetical protein